MVHVAVWRNLSLLALCHSCLQCSGTSISIIERDVEPTTFVTSAATSDTEPICLVLPMLLDVQPVLLKVDVTRHVPAQIQSFCREHAVDVTRCAGAIREALDEVVNFQRFCKKATADSALPGFVVAKNVLQESGESASASWLQNDPRDVAIDFCGFAQAKVGGAGLETDECVEALGNVLHLSFDWMVALTPCEKRGEGSDGVAASELETQSIVDRLATVKEMIAALQSSSVVENDMSSLMPGDGHTEISDTSFRDDDSVVEEISEAEEPTVVTEENIVDMQEGRAASNDSEENVGNPSAETKTTDVNLAKESVAERHTTDQSAELKEITSHNGEETSSESEEELQEVTEVVDSRNLAEVDGFVESEVTGVGNGLSEAEHTSLQVEERSRIDEELQSQKSWKVGAALVLVLSILYLTIDLMLHCMHSAVDHLGDPKQFFNVVLHDILLIVRGGSRGTMKKVYSNASGSDDLKKPMPRRPKVSPEGELSRSQWRSKSSAFDAQNSSARSQAAADASYHPSPSFTCVAMMLMAGRHAPIANDAFALAQDTFELQKLPTSSFVPDSNEALNIIQQKYQCESAAVQRIQKAWKASQRKHENVLNATTEDALGKADSSAPIFRLRQLRSTTTAQTPRADTGAAGLHRLVPNTLPPR